jgi:hypothetical protein
MNFLLHVLSQEYEGYLPDLYWLSLPLSMYMSPGYFMQSLIWLNFETTNIQLIKSLINDDDYLMYWCAQMEDKDWIAIAAILATAIVALISLFINLRYNRQSNNDRVAREDLIRAQERKTVPHIEFSIECNVYGPEKGNYLAEFLLIACNRGDIQHKFKKIVLRVRGIESEKPLCYWNGHEPRLNFPVSILDYVYLFSWDKIPEIDNGRLMEFLVQKFDIDWVRTAKIEKIENDKIIQVSNEKNSLFLIHNYGETEAILVIDDGRIDKFKVAKENDKLNIYDNVNVIPAGYNYFFVEPGVKQVLTYVTKIPSSIKYVQAFALFEYDKYNPHTTERVFQMKPISCQSSQEN